MVYAERESLTALSRTTPSTALALAALTILNYVFLGFGHLRSLVPWNLKLRFTEWFGLAVLTGFVDRLVPARGGALVRFAYLRDRYRISVRSFALSIAYLFFVSLFSLGLAGCALSLATIGRADAGVLGRFAPIYAIALLGGGAGLFAPVRLFALAARLSSRAA